jgi:DNA-binding NarL/FixJ family response regulator
MKKRVVIVDPHASVRQMLAVILPQRTDLDVVGEADTGLKGLQICRQLAPNLMIFELILPELCGVEMLRRLRSEGSRARALIYSGASTDLQISRGLRSKPHGFVTKCDSLMTLCEAVRIVVDGGAYFSASVGNLWSLAHTQAAESMTLSNREREVLQMVAESSSSKDIATRLALSVKTVQNHRMRIMDKLNLHDTAALTRFAIRQGLVN